MMRCSCFSLLLWRKPQHSPSLCPGQTGLRGCGIKLAYGVSRYGLGDSLLHAARSASDKELANFLIGWRRELTQILRHDPKGLIGRKNCVVANAVTDGFPDLTVVRNYTNPVTSWSGSCSGEAFDSSCYI